MPRARLMVVLRHVRRAVDRLSGARDVRRMMRFAHPTVGRRRKPHQEKGRAQTGLSGAPTMGDRIDNGPVLGEVEENLPYNTRGASAEVIDRPKIFLRMRVDVETGTGDPSG